MCRMASPSRDPRTGVYYIRVAIPHALKSYFKEHFGKGYEWKKQLLDHDTGDKARSESQAKRLWADYWAEWITAKEAAEAEVHGTEFRLTDRQADGLCADWLAAQLAEYEDIPDYEQRDLHQDAFIDVLEVNRYREKPSYAHLSRYFERDSYVSDEAAKLLQTHRVPLPRGSDAFLGFCERLARTGIQLVRSLDDRAGGDWRTPEAVSNAPTVGLVGSGKGETITEVYEAFKAERKFNERQLMEFNKPINDLIELVGDLPVTRVTPSHISSFKEGLVKQGLAAATVNGRLSTLRGLFGFAKGNAKITGVNPADEIKNIKKTKENSTDRVNWTPAELQRLLSGPVHADLKRPTGGQKEASFWLPLFGLLMGGRLQDFTQLLMEDVGVTDTNIPFIDINKKHGKRLKNDSGPRILPLHHKLEEWGFMTYIAQRRKEGAADQDPVFPGVKMYRDQAAKNWGQWFSRYKTDKVKIPPAKTADEKKDFHSFRHMWTDAAKNSGITMDMRHEIKGQKPPSVGERYGSEGFNLEVTKRELDKLVYPGVDLSVVKSKWS